MCMSSGCKTTATLKKIYTEQQLRDSSMVWCVYLNMWKLGDQITLHNYQVGHGTEDERTMLEMINGRQLHAPVSVDSHVSRSHRMVSNASHHNGSFNRYLHHKGSFLSKVFRLSKCILSFNPQKYGLSFASHYSGNCWDTGKNYCISHTISCTRV